MSEEKNGTEKSLNIENNALKGSIFISNTNKSIIKDINDLIGFENIENLYVSFKSSKIDNQYLVGIDNDASITIKLCSQAYDGSRKGVTIEITQKDFVSLVSFDFEGVSVVLETHENNSIQNIINLVIGYVDSVKVFGDIVFSETDEFIEELKSRIL